MPPTPENSRTSSTAGVIKVGIALTGEPIGFRDADNNPVGYDVEVAKRLADTLGVKLEITEVSGAVRITMLQSGQIDVVIANMTANLERAKAVDFTIPYLRSGIKILDPRGHRREVARRPQGQEGHRRTRHDRTRR